MTATIFTTPLGRSSGAFKTAVEAWETGQSGDGTWVEFGKGPVTVGVGGDASAYEVQVWRAFGDPTGFTAAMKAGASLTGAAGEVAPTTYQEDAVGYWMVQVISVAGGTANVGMSGSIS